LEIRFIEAVFSAMITEYLVGLEGTQSFGEG